MLTFKRTMVCLLISGIPFSCLQGMFSPYRLIQPYLGNRFQSTLQANIRSLVFNVQDLFRDPIAALQDQITAEFAAKIHELVIHGDFDPSSLNDFFCGYTLSSLFPNVHTLRLSGAFPDKTVLPFWITGSSITTLDLSTSCFTNRILFINTLPSKLEKLNLVGREISTLPFPKYSEELLVTTYQHLESPNQHVRVEKLPTPSRYDPKKFVFLLK